MHKPVLHIYLLVATLSFLASTVLADGAAVFSGNTGERGGKGTMHIRWSGKGKVRMDASPAGGGYTVLTGGRVYSVMTRGARPEVYDMTAMMQQMRGMMPAPKDQAGPMDNTVTNASNTGRSEKVAGYTGDVYKVTTRSNGRLETLELVISQDPDVVEATQAWLAMASHMAGNDADAMTGPDSIGAFLNRKRAGLLRAGNEFRLKSLTPGKVDPGLFKLPAKPTAMPSFGGMPGGR
jgi:hypothetical protein